MTYRDPFRRLFGCDLERVLSHLVEIRHLLLHIARNTEPPAKFLPFRMSVRFGPSQKETPSR